MDKCYTIFFIFFLLSACSADKQTEKLLKQVDSVLEEYPDSALHLLDALPNPQELSRKESARYALLLARATDKAVKSLLPCDSLLDIALHYYDKDEKERAVALLYKGRLEAEMNNVEEAIVHLQEGVTILEAFPKEIETRRLTLNSLGNLYFNARHYEEAIKIFRAFYDCCLTDKDKSIALNDIATYYSITDMGDSAIIIQQKALEYAIISDDSTQIASSELNLSLEYDSQQKLDSALYHVYNAIEWLPTHEKHENYYGHLGSLLLAKGENKDSAIYYLNKSMEDSTNIKGKAITLLELYDIEKERGNYQAATTYLEEHVAILDSLSVIENSTTVQQLIHEYNTKVQVREEQIKGQHQIPFIIATSIFSFLIIILVYQHRLNKRKRIQLVYQQTLKLTQGKLCSLQNTIEENQHIIISLQKKYSNLKEKQENKRDEIQKREHIIEKLKQEKQELRLWLFTQSEIYKKIDILSKQDVSDKKNRKVMTTLELKKLKKTVFGIYVDYILQIQEKYPKLVEEDILYLCLEDAQLAPLTIALCFGFHDTHPINQRKYRIKERMNDDNM